MSKKLTPLLEILDLFLTAIKQGRKIQIRPPDTAKWVEITTEQLQTLADVGLLNLSFFRLKPNEILVNLIRVPAPEDEAPPIGTQYFIPCFGQVDGTSQLSWDGGEIDRLLLDRRVIHLTAEGARAHFSAMTDLTEL